MVLIIGEVFIEVLIPFYTARLVNMIKAGTEMRQVVALGLEPAQDLPGLAPRQALPETFGATFLPESRVFPLRISISFLRLRL